MDSRLGALPDDVETLKAALVAEAARAAHAEAERFAAPNIAALPRRSYRAPATRAASRAGQGRTAITIR
jgi:hypothetical protein